MKMHSEKEMKELIPEGNTTAEEGTKMLIKEHINNFFRNDITNKEKKLHKLWIKYLLNEHYSENMEELRTIAHAENSEFFDDLIQKEKKRFGGDVKLLHEILDLNAEVSHDNLPAHLSPDFFDI